MLQVGGCKLQVAGYTLKRLRAGKLVDSRATGSLKPSTLRAPPGPIKPNNLAPIETVNLRTLDARDCEHATPGLPTCNLQPATCNLQFHGNARNNTRTQPGSGRCIHVLRSGGRKDRLRGAEF